MTTINKEKKAYFQLPNKYKEAALTLAKLQYERERTAEKFEYNSYKDEKYFETMRNRIISDNCNKIAETYSDTHLEKLNEDHNKMLTELQRLQNSKTSSMKFDQVYNRSLER